MEAPTLTKGKVLIKKGKFLKHPSFPISLFLGPLQLGLEVGSQSHWPRGNFRKERSSKQWQPFVRAWKKGVVGIFYSFIMVDYWSAKTKGKQLIKSLACVEILKVGPFRLDCQKVSKSISNVFFFPEKSKSRCYSCIFMSQSSHSCSTYVAQYNYYYFFYSLLNF